MDKNLGKTLTITELELQIFSRQLILNDFSEKKFEFIQQQHVAIIGVGGIHTADDAIEKLEAGASLVQLYTGFIYEGPALIKAINKKILSNYPKS